MKIQNIAWGLIVALGISIGLYPFSFLVTDSAEGFIEFKQKVITPNTLWLCAFYTHILLGGVALLVGLPQFSKKFRSQNIGLHKVVGKVYVTVVFISAIAGFYMALFANGGLIAKLGFSGMVISWVLTTALAYTSIRKKDIEQHQKWMIRSYAVTFTGVTFRLWLPLLLFGFDMDFLMVYRIDSWISWVFNLVLAEILISQMFGETRLILKSS